MLFQKPKVVDDLFRANAIRGILFKGLEDSGRMKGRKALVTDGYESHKDYFDSFLRIPFIITIPELLWMAM